MFLEKEYIQSLSEDFDKCLLSDHSDQNNAVSIGTTYFKWSTSEAPFRAVYF